MRGCAEGRRFFSACGETVNTAQSLRKQYLRLMDRAAGSGIRDAENLWHLTPREIMARLKREKALRYASDKMAWVMARYIALAVHCPEKLPPAPMDPVEEGGEMMSPDEMKNRMRALGGVKRV
ncbi:MAG: hypothetical protein IKT57_05900 [Clostridia bacterium]|nr:hypothetical protein [Clostridia bacterium]